MLDLIERETNATYRRKTAHEYAGACPFCRAGDDRFRIWPEEGRYWCRVCGRKGDTIQFLRDLLHLSFAQAKEMTGGIAVGIATPRPATPRAANASNTLDAPSAAWLAQARPLVKECYHKLYGFTGSRALAWLEKRGLARDILHGNGVGFNPDDLWLEREAWGLEPAFREDGAPKGLWLPKGIVIPWFFENELWGIRIRRPAGELKYYWLPGGVMGLYGATTIKAGWPVVLCEGELDALTIRQALTTPTAAVVATGSTQGGRHLRWLARLASASVVLVAFDADDAGEKAAGYWLDALPNARRWRPYWGDANEMAQDGADIAAWIQAGIVAVASCGE